ncbi:MAG: beta-lactamase family protein [Sphingomonas sp.]|nr:beta-lactamase family protein [Sphingomonas sp.]
MRCAILLAGLILAGCQTRPIEAPDAAAGATYAWAGFDATGVRRSDAAGLAERRHGRPATASDPVRVASVSKLVVALGVLRLVEQGRIDLDADISGWLGWELRNPAFPERLITLRMLLSHTSGLRDAGEAYVIPLGRTVRAALADPRVFDPDHVPGTYFQYANLNFPVIASALERATGERFDRLIHGLVMEPLGLDACFNWTMCSDANVARAVTLHRADGSIALDDLQGARPACPVFRETENCDLVAYELGANGALFSPQGGLRASVLDLATIGRMLLNRGRHEGTQFLSEASIDAILRPAWVFNGSNGDTDNGFYCSYGLAVQTLPVRVAGCNDDLFAGRAALGHAGEAYNLRSGLWIDPARNVGIAYFAANNPAPQPAGRSAFRAIEEWLAAKIGD